MALMFGTAVSTTEESKILSDYKNYASSVSEMTSTKREVRLKNAEQDEAKLQKDSNKRKSRPVFLQYKTTVKSVEVYNVSILKTVFKLNFSDQFSHTL